jgi:SAM-dependent methyltransferase
MRLLEFSPSTLQGSFESGLILNKLWLIHELKKIQDQFSTIYILGSWYGNMSILLAKNNIQYDHIVNVDRDPRVVRKAQRIARILNIDDRIEPMVKDANRLDYQQLDQDGLVINTSCHDMKNRGWFDHIPAGVLVALQSRDDVDDDLSNYQLSNILYQGSRSAQDPETRYTSILRIGIK